VAGVELVRFRQAAAEQMAMAPARNHWRCSTRPTGAAGRAHLVEAQADHVAAFGKRAAIFGEQRQSPQTNLVFSTAGFGVLSEVRIIRADGVTRKPRPDQNLQPKRTGAPELDRIMLAGRQRPEPASRPSLQAQAEKKT
jgi:hypothetical protein